MAKRKRKPQQAKPFQLPSFTDYRADEYIPYLKEIETGILQAAAIDPAVTDGDVDKELKRLITKLKEPHTLQNLLADFSEGEEEKIGEPDLAGTFAATIIEHRILWGLYQAFQQEGPLPAEDVIGIFKVIRSSLRVWGHGSHRRGYLNHLEDFLAQLGIFIQRDNRG